MGLAGEGSCGTIRPRIVHRTTLSHARQTSDTNRDRIELRSVAMIVSKIRGGLGNQLFEYAAGRCLADMHNTSLLLDASWYKSGRRPFWLDQFRINADISRDDHSQAEDGIGFNQQHWCFYTGFLKYPGYRFLSGWWQSERFFAPAADIIRNDLAFSNPELQNEARSWHRRFRAELNDPVVALHVRRQDYVRLSAQGHFSLPNQHYYRAAMAECPQNSVFLLFSDDLPWCRENMNYPGVAFCDIKDTLLSFAVMQLCDHFIIANSTFSWWAAWLGEKPSTKVISPRSEDWFGPNHGKKNETGHIIPPRWIQLSATGS